MRKTVHDFVDDEVTYEFGKSVEAFNRENISIDWLRDMVFKAVNKFKDLSSENKTTWSSETK